VSNRPRQRPAKQVQRERPAGELKYELRIAPPDGELDADGNSIPVELVVDLRHFTLDERQLAKRALLKFAQPPDWEDVIVVHAFVVWRRTHPAASLQFWMEHIEWGDLLDGLALEPGHVAWDTTPEGYDPNP